MTITDEKAHDQTVALATGGLERFTVLAEKLPALLEQLRAMPPMTGRLPISAGVYLFCEGDIPMYVGQTRRLRQRMRQHSGLTARHNQAVFAFSIAKAEAARQGVDVRRTRLLLEQDPTFAELFRQARARVASMDVRFVEISDPELRTVFEVYAAVAFGTQEYNSFDTH